MSNKSREDLVETLNRINKSVTFKDAHLELMTDERAESLATFIKEHFHPDETLSKSIGLDFDDEMAAVIKHALRENLSIILVSEATDEIIACRTLFTDRKDQSMDLTSLKNEKIVKIFNFLSQKKNEMDIFKRFDVDIAIRFLTLGTHRNHRRQGIATKIFKAALLFCKELGLDSVCIHGEGTSNHSQKIYEKFEFEVIHTYRYDDYKVDGEIVFKNTGDNESTKLYVKQL